MPSPPALPPSPTPASPRAPRWRLSPERMDWNLLRTFVFVVQARGVGRAAERLSLSQPAVSQALRRLEDSVGGMLLHRRHGEFRLTQLGQEVHAIAREMYGSASRLVGASPPDEEEVTGTLRLLMMSRVHSAAYDDWLADFHQRHPLVRFRVEVHPSATVLEMLAQGSAALGLCLCRHPVAGLERRLVLRHRYVVVCGPRHPLFGQAEVTLDDLRRHNFICFPSDQIGDTLSPLTMFRDQQGFHGEVLGLSANVEEVRRLVRAGLGLSFLPEHLIQADLDAGQLRRLPPPEPVAELDVFLAWQGQRRLSRAEAAFLAAFDQFLEQVPLEQRSR